MFPKFTEFDSPVNDAITIHGKKGGTGPPLLLLHGFPQNHLIWHKIAPHLTPHYTLVALDLRGYGLSSKPASTPNHSTYSKSAMAADCVFVMRSLGYSNFYICAHDRGARVAHKLCVDFPDAVSKVIMLDIAPTAAMYAATDHVFAKAYWHWFFLVQDSPFPEKMMLGDVDALMSFQMGRVQIQAEREGRDVVFEKECWESYKSALGKWENVHAMCEDYRAAAGIDIEEFEADEEAGRKVECELMVLWGKMGVVERCFDAMAEWKKVASGKVVGEALECGHFIPEEVPGVLAEKIMGFLRE
ncbi:MAG: hypothetical protein Q9190_004004 [Brigantiaea leucoxantha]